LIHDTDPVIIPKLIKLFILKYTISLLFLAIIILKSESGCTQNKSNQKFEAIEVRDHSPMMGETFYRVYYVSNLVMYESQYRIDSFVNPLRYDSTTHEIKSNMNLVNQEWKSEFFVFHSDSSYGYRYDSNDEIKNGRFKVDSVIKTITGTNRWDSFLYVKPDSVLWSKEKKELLEVFLFPAKGDMPSSILNLYYSKKLNDVQFSFNTTVDSIKGLKLYKTEYFVDAALDEKNNMVWPSSKNSTEMRKILIDDSNENLHYFNLYKKAINQLH
jgi:hypothetical protein